LLRKTNKLSIVGGFLDGHVLDAAGVKALANLPSLDELRSKLIAVISAPATKLAILAKEPATRVARVLACSKLRQNLKRIVSINFYRVKELKNGKS
jgi:ribosomal protein L10